MNRLQQAMLINAKFDHYYATTEAPDEIGQFNVIYDALLEIDERLEIDELINAAESEQLDEEVVYELTPAGEAYLDELEEADEAQPGEYSADLSEEFNDFSRSVGTFEGSIYLADLVGRDRDTIESFIDRAVAADPTISRPVLRAPVGERVYGDDNVGQQLKTLLPAAGSVRQGVRPTKTISEAFTPCGAD